MLHDPDILTGLLLTLLALVLVLTFALFFLSGRGSRRSRARVEHAAEGERAAEILLESLGYEILERQASRRWTMRIDGEDREILARADFIVQRSGLTWVAEVKTGALATDPTYPPTRRQLLEYLFVFDPDGLLLVDPDAKRVFDVSFPGLEEEEPEE